MPRLAATDDADDPLTMSLRKRRRGASALRRYSLIAWPSRRGVLALSDQEPGVLPPATGCRSFKQTDPHRHHACERLVGQRPPQQYRPAAADTPSRVGDTRAFRSWPQSTVRLLGRSRPRRLALLSGAPP